MNIDFSKNSDKLVPALIVDASTQKVLMLGYMNNEAYTKTISSGKVTFFSRSKNRLWTKGEESGHFLELVDVKIDCDNDTLLISVHPKGPTCHTGTDTCWGERNDPSFGFFTTLEAIIASRKLDSNNPTSYIASLFRSGINKIAQKVGEEAVETVIEAKDNNNELFLDEASDLLFHYLILLQAKGFTLADIEKRLQSRHK